MNLKRAEVVGKREGRITLYRWHWGVRLVLKHFGYKKKEAICLRGLQKNRVPRIQPAFNEVRWIEPSEKRLKNTGVDWFHIGNWEFQEVEGNGAGVGENSMSLREESWGTWWPGSGIMMESGISRDVWMGWSAQRWLSSRLPCGPDHLSLLWGGAAAPSGSLRLAGCNYRSSTACVWWLSFIFFYILPLLLLPILSIYSWLEEEYFNYSDKRIPSL